MFVKKASKEQQHLERVCNLKEHEFQTMRFEMGCAFLEKNNLKGTNSNSHFINDKEYWIWWNKEFDLFIKRQNDLLIPWDYSLWKSIVPTIKLSPLLRTKFHLRFYKTSFLPYPQLKF